MKKMGKRLFSALLALLMLAACGVPVLADEEETASAEVSDIAEPAADASEAEAVEAAPAEEADEAEAEPEPVIEEAETAPVLDGATEVASGTCGKNLTWVLDDSGKLTIDGDGAMTEHPWTELFADGASYEPGGPSSDPNSYARVGSIKSVVIGDGVSNIVNQAFWGCADIESVHIGDGVRAIGVAAFAGCIKLESVIIPDSVTSVGGQAFMSCTGLVSITMPRKVTSVGDSAFNNCISLSEVHISDLVGWCESRYTWAANPLIQGHNLYLNDELVTELVIPEGVTSIPNSAFMGCSSFSSVTLPDSVTSIGSDAFCKCTGMVSITLPKRLTSIGSAAFGHCTSLQSITIPSGVQNFGDQTFSGCTSLESVVIPEGVTTIEWWDFIDCTSLTSIVIPRTVTSIGDSAFSNCWALEDVVFEGTEEEWNAINIHIGNDALLASVIKFDPRPLHEHDWGEWTVSQQATCLDWGEMMRVCKTDASHIETELIYPLGHDLQLVEAVPASQTAEGVMEHYECERCGAIFKDAKSMVPMTIEELTIPRIEVKEDITVTEDLKDKDIRTEEDVREKLEEAAEDKGYDRKNTVTVEVTLPQNQQPDALIGISILLPYPEGTDMEHFDFDVFHMISTGDKAGQTELVICTKTEYGLMITVFSLSPFTIAWEPVLDGRADTSAYFLANGMEGYAAANLRKAVGLE